MSVSLSVCVCFFFFLPLLSDQAQAVTSGPVTAEATSCDTGMCFPMSTVVIIIPLTLHAHSFLLTYTI